MQYPPHPFTYSIVTWKQDIIVFNKTSVSRNTRIFWKRTDIVRLHQYLHSYRICINFYPAHTLPEPPLHRTRTPRIQKLPLTQPRKLRQQKPPQPHNSPGRIIHTNFAAHHCKTHTKNCTPLTLPPPSDTAPHPPSTQPSGTPSSPNTNTQDPKTPAHTTPKAQTTKTPAAAQPPPHHIIHINFAADHCKIHMKKCTLTPRETS